MTGIYKVILYLICYFTNLRMVCCSRRYHIEVYVINTLLLLSEPWCHKMFEFQKHGLVKLQAIGRPTTCLSQLHKTHPDPRVANIHDFETHLLLNVSLLYVTLAKPMGLLRLFDELKIKILIFFKGVC